jgi:6-pyruvoyltetrahydropterin/6-carboxytetrahydropterin synthase
MSFRITRTHEICCGHRVVGHEGKCRHLHGHNYTFHLTCEAVELDAVGRVVDFSVIKARLCEWLEAEWDHRMLLWQHDPEWRAIAAIDPAVVAVPFNPTAENIARHLVEVVGPACFVATPGVRLVAVTVFETAKCSATYEALS